MCARVREYLCAGASVLLWVVLHAKKYMCLKERSPLNTEKLYFLKVFMLKNEKSLYICIKIFIQCRLLNFNFENIKLNYKM